ncbi:sugar ABC transporter permease [Lachnospiraceae bacterium 54-11]|jgi:raffinose/stachyose/melibiose transport system permease protein|nr:sugar ABC transporter permease [Lachnospiraceae bacterium]
MHKTKRYRKQVRNFVFFLIPSIGIYTFFWVVPIIFNFVVSASAWNGMSAFAETKWVGLKNYVKIFTNDTMFPKAFGHNIVFTLITVICIPLISCLLAIAVERFLRHKGIFRTLFFIPAIVPLLAAAILFQWIYSIDGGLLNEALGLIGLKALQRNFLGDSRTALGAVSFISVWKSIPFYMTILISGLQGIPEELEEAAKIDGADGRKVLRYVTLPLLKPILVIVFGLVVIDGFRTFDLIYATTNGGPNYATEIMTTYIYRVGFGDFRMGYATALSSVNIIFVLIITSVYLRISNKSNLE